jgi:hypothetical protein
MPSPQRSRYRYGFDWSQARTLNRVEYSSAGGGDAVAALEKRFEELDEQNRKIMQALVRYIQTRYPNDDALYNVIGLPLESREASE